MKYEAAAEDLGCWNDGSPPAIQTLEGTHEALKDDFSSRIDPKGKCLEAAVDFGKIRLDFDVVTSTKLSFLLSVSITQ